MNWISTRPWLGTVARLVLGVVFVIAGWAKLNDPRTFVRAVRAYDATPEWLSRGIGYGLPVLEVCVGILLIVGIIQRAAAIIAGSLTVVFLIGILQASARGLKLECGCFGGGGATTGQTSYLLDIARDVGLLVLAMFVIVWPITRLSVDEFLARNDDVEKLSAKRMRTEQGQRKYNAMREARLREARVRTRFLNIGLVILIALVSLIGVGVQSKRAQISGDLTATNASVVNGVVVGKTSKVTVDVFEDFQCPFCAAFQQSAGADIDSMITTGTAQFRFHMVSFLDGSSGGNKYSSRAANAGLCASDISAAQFLKYHDYLFQANVQPGEGKGGRTDVQLIGYASSVGVTSTALATFQTCVQTQQHKALVLAITQNWSERGLNTTPVVIVNGKKLSSTHLTKAGLDAAVAAAAAA